MMPGAMVLAADGTPLYCEVRGSGPPVYVCHGGPHATYSYMRGALEPLERDFTLIYHDYRGSGRSGVAASDTYTFAHLATDLDALRAHLGHEQLVVLAHSLGGFVALHYALQYDQRLRALVLVATTPTGAVRRLWWPTLRALGVRRIARFLITAAGYSLAWSWRPDGLGRQRARHRMLALLQEGRADRRERVRAAESAAAVVSDNAASLEAEAYRTDLTPHLGSIRCPVLVICGARDAVFYAASALYSRHLPSAVVVTFPGVGHHPALEEPDIFTRVVTGFLRDAWCGAAASG